MSSLNLIPNHLEAITQSVSNEKGMGQLKQYYSSFKNQFIENSVRGIIHPTDRVEETRDLLIEEIPGAIPCFRVYYELAQQKNLTAFVLKHATLETFLLSSEGMPSIDHPKTFQMGDDKFTFAHGDRYNNVGFRSVKAAK